MKDQDEFNRRRNLGCEYFHGKLPAAVEDVEAWLDELTERISEFATWDYPDDGFAYRGHRKTEFWSMTIYPYPVEIVGGANDGAEVVPAFQLDLRGVIGLFDEIEEFYSDTSAIGPSDCPLIPAQVPLAPSDLAAATIILANTVRRPASRSTIASS